MKLSKSITAVICALVLGLTLVSAGGCKKKKNEDVPKIPEGVTLSKVEDGQIESVYSDFSQKYAKSENVRADFSIEQSLTVTGRNSGVTDIAYSYEKQRADVKYFNNGTAVYGDADARVFETSVSHSNDGYTLSSPDYAKYNYSRRSITPAVAKLRDGGISVVSNGEKQYKNNKLDYSREGLTGYYTDFLSFGTASAVAETLTSAVGMQGIFARFGQVLEYVTAEGSVTVGGVVCPKTAVKTSADVRADSTKFYGSITVEIVYEATADGASQKVEYRAKSAIYADVSSNLNLKSFDKAELTNAQTAGVRYMDISNEEFFDCFFNEKPLTIPVKGAGSVSGFSLSPQNALYFNYMYGGEYGHFELNFLFSNGVITLPDNAFTIFKSRLGGDFVMEKLDFCYAELKGTYYKLSGSDGDRTLDSCRSELLLMYSKAV